MPIDFTCPHCGTRTNVADQYAGQSGPCARCGKTITVPTVPGMPFAATPAKSTSSLPIVIVVVVGLLGVAIVVVAILAALLLPAVSSAREAARRAACLNNLHQIALAMQNYHTAHDTFPPAYLADKNGKPMHSWRVLLLPYLGQDALYRRYNFKEPWNSPGNQAVTASLPPMFRCPSDSTINPTETNYVMIVGPQTISAGANAVKLKDITDGTSSTLMIVEVTGTGIHWAEPRDLKADAIDFSVDHRDGAGIGSQHPGGANAAFLDGSVRFLNGDTDPDDVRAMSTISGGEHVRAPF